MKQLTLFQTMNRKRPREDDNVENDGGDPDRAASLENDNGEGTTDDTKVYDDYWRSWSQPIPSSLQKGLPQFTAFNSSRFWPYTAVLPNGVRRGFTETKKSPGCTTVAFTYELLQKGIFMDEKVFLDRYRYGDNIWAGVQRLLAVSTEMEHECREQLTTLLSFGVLERARRYEAARAIIKFFEDRRYVASPSEPC